MNKLELFRPTRPYIIGQNFGENMVCSNPDKTGVVTQNPDGTCPVGKVKLYSLLGMKGHTGTDLYAPDGWIVRAAHDGIVKEINTEVERGLGVGIITEDIRDIGPNGNFYVKTRYWHLKQILVSKDQKVKVGDILGLADSTGLSSASHLHFECKPVAYLPNGTHYNIFQNNGYFGAIDPKPYMSTMYADEYADIRATLQALTIKVANLINSWLKR